MRKGYLAAIPALAYLAARPVKGHVLAKSYDRMNLPQATEAKGRKRIVIIDRITRKQMPSGWKLSYGKDIKDIDGAVVAFLPSVVARTVGKKQARLLTRNLMTGRDWTIPQSRESHVNTLTLGSALHEAGHAQDYARNPQRASLLALKVPEIAPLIAVTTAMGLVILSKRMRNPKQFLKFLGQKPEILTAMGMAPLIYREAVATATAMKHTKKGRKSLIPLMASYGALASIPVVAVNIAKRLI